MGSATAILAAEHAAIQRAVGVLGRLCEQAAAGAADDHAHSAGQVLEFLREFAQRCHNAKEEELLFPALVRRGIPSNRGLLAAQLAGRRQGRQLMDAMTWAQAAWAAGKAGAGSRFSAAATAYHALLEQHVAAEHDVVFAVAEQALDDVAQDALTHAFGRFELQVLGTGRRSALYRQLDRLLLRYPSAAIATAHAGVASKTPGAELDNRLGSQPPTPVR
jgi:hemerythrin-like domain-containing protein